MPTVNDTLIEIRDILAGIRSDMNDIGGALYTELTILNSAFATQLGLVNTTLTSLNESATFIYNNTGSIIDYQVETLAAIQALDLNATSNTNVIVQSTLGASCPCPDEYTTEPLPPGETNCTAQLIPMSPDSVDIEATVGDYFSVPSGGSSASEFVVTFNGVEVWRTDIVSGEIYNITESGFYTVTIEGGAVPPQPFSHCVTTGAQETSDKCQRAQATVDGFREILRIMRTYRPGTVLTKSLINDAWSYAIALWGDRRSNTPPADNVQAMITAWTTGRTGWDWSLLTVLDLARDAAVMAIYNASTPEEAAIALGEAVYAEGSIDPRYDAFVSSMFELDILNKVFTPDYDGFAVGGYSSSFCDPA